MSCSVKCIMQTFTHSTSGQHRCSLLGVCPHVCTYRNRVVPNPVPYFNICEGAVVENKDSPGLIDRVCIAQFQLLLIS